jgi:glutathione peroxidase-family protein
MRSLELVLRSSTDDFLTAIQCCQNIVRRTTYVELALVNAGQVSFLTIASVHTTYTQTKTNKVFDSTTSASIVSCVRSKYFVLPSPIQLRQPRWNHFLFTLGRRGSVVHRKKPKALPNSVGREYDKHVLLRRLTVGALEIWKMDH